MIGFCRVFIHFDISLDMNYRNESGGVRMKSCKILCVCSVGLITSNMVAARLKEHLAERGWDALTRVTTPDEVASDLKEADYDLMACVTHVYEDYGIPKINALGLLAGTDVDKVVDDCIRVLEEKKS